MNLNLQALVPITVQARIKNTEGIVSLTLYGAYDEHIPELVKVFPKNCTKLIFSCVKITLRGLEMLKPLFFPPFEVDHVSDFYLKTNYRFWGDLIVHPECALTHLSLVAIDAEYDDFLCFFKALTSPECRLKALKMEEFLMDTEESMAYIIMRAFTEAIPWTTLETLTIDRCSYLNGKTWESFMDAITKNQTIRSLQVKSIITNDHVPALCRALQNNTKIIHLNLSRNIYRLQPIIDMLQTNYVVQEIETGMYGDNVDRINELLDRNILMRKKRLSLMPTSRWVWRSLCQKMLL